MRLRVIFAGVALVMYTTDVVSKIVAADRLAGRGDVSVIGDVLTLRLARNPGAAFNAGVEYTVVITFIAIVASLAVLWFSRRIGSLAWALALGFLLAGITGNLTDRMFRAPGPFRGEVIDFLMLPNWPIFNVADICINVGAGLILLQAFRGIRLDGTRDPERNSDSSRDPEATS
ncbi:signal peptidase II [Nocardioides salsibiostraticola]